MTNTQQQQVEKVAERIVDKALDRLAADPNVNLSTASAKEIKTEVEKKITQVVVNQTNQEPWYQSTVYLGIIVTLVTGVLGVFGYTFSDEDRQTFLQLALQIGQIVGLIGAVVGALISWWGRFRAARGMTVLQGKQDT